MKISILKSVYILVFLLFGCLENVTASIVMVLQHKNGETIRYSFSVHPIMSFDDKMIILSTDEAEITYAMSDYEKLYFEDETSKIENIRNTEEADTVFVYDTIGRLIKKSKSVLNYSHFNLPKGVYIIKQGKSSIKISIK